MQRIHEVQCLAVEVPAISRAPLTSRAPHSLSDDHKLIVVFLERARLRSASTARTYAQAIRRFLRWYGAALADVRYADLLAYQAGPSDAGGLKDLAPATQTRHLMTLKALFGFAVDSGYLAADPTKLLLTPKSCPKPQTWLTAEEMARMLMAVSIGVSKARGPWGKVRALRDQAVVSFACMTGCRSAEMSAIAWCDFYRDPNGHLGVRIQGKGGRAREVKILPALWSILTAYRSAMGLCIEVDPLDGHPLFINRHGDRLSELGNARIIAAIAKQAGIAKKVSPHAIRRGVATAALKGGASLRQVQAQLGHASLNTTQRYLYELEGLQDTAADYLSGLAWAIAASGEGPVR